ncbi:MAG: DNA-processing protein DprA [Planctomycetaceae bacterium]
MKTVEQDLAALAAAVRIAMVPGAPPRLARVFGEGGGGLFQAVRAGPRALQRRLGLSHEAARELARAIARADPAPELEEAVQKGIEVRPLGGEAYPAALAPLSDPPPALWLRGSLLPCDGVAVALVGSRDATPYGRRIAHALAADLGRAGVTVISGLARGIDAAAHEGALSAAGRTVAVLGSGLLEPYPPEHLGLLERIAQQGAVLSEFPLHTPPRPLHFPRRNRLIAALALATVVVEAGPGSGALGTARHALDLGREVLAVPGPVDSPQSEGTLRLLREGAAPVASARDIFAALGWCAAGPLQLPAEERRVLEALGEGPMLAEEAAQAARLPVEAAAGLLVTLEVRGLVVRGVDGRYRAR